MRYNNTALKVADELLVLERGRDELLLTNNIKPRPLYINKGRRYILEFLKAAGELGTYKKIITTYPHEVNLLDVMLDYGIMVPHGTNRQHKNLKLLSERRDCEKRKVMSLFLLISQSCNMGCVYCLNGRNTYHTDKGLMMGKEVAFRSIERCLEDIAPSGCLEIIFFGGEPLLNWPLVKEIILFCENSLSEKRTDKQLKYHITSNLSLLPNDLVEWAQKYNITFLCDVDGPEPIHNRCRPFKNGRPTHNIIVRHIKHLLTAGLQVDLRTTITAINQDYLVETTEHHKAIGANASAFVPVHPVNSDGSILPERMLPSPDKVIEGMTNVYASGVWKSGEISPFNQYATRFMPEAITVIGCGAPYGNTPVVDVNGDVYPCIYLVGIKIFHMGNMIDGSYPKKNALAWMYEDVHVDHREDCNQCSWRYICGGGCPLGYLTVLNNPSASPEVKMYCTRMCCDYTKRMLELVLWNKAQAAASNCLGDSLHVLQCV
jgi:uncharacterized protein